MYFLKKITNFGNNKNENVDPLENVVSSTSFLKPENSVQQDRNNKNGESAIGRDQQMEFPELSGIHRTNSILSVSSHASIPDCFFDDLSETASSESENDVRSTSSEETKKDAELDISLKKQKSTAESCSWEKLETVAPCLVGSPGVSGLPFFTNTPCSAFFNDIETDDLSKNFENVNSAETDAKDDRNIMKVIEEQTKLCKINEPCFSFVSENLYAEQDTKDDASVHEVQLNQSLAEMTHSVGPKGDAQGLELQNNLKSVSNFLDSSQNKQQKERFFEKSWEESSDEEKDGISGLTHVITLDSDCIEDYLDKENNKAEARLADRRKARVEAREIRLRELERQQKEQEESADRAFDMTYGGDSILRTGRGTPSSTSLNPRERSITIANSYHSSRRSSEDSIEEGLTLRDIRHELKEAEEKFKKAMIANAQLDNEKSALVYQVELLKDRFEDLEETHAQLTREHRDKCREHEQLKRAAVKLKEDLEFFKTNLLERDRLIAEYGLVIVDADGNGDELSKRTLVSNQSANILQEAGCGSLDGRLKKFFEERNELLDEIRHLKLELEEEKNKRISDNKVGYGSLANGSLDEETNQILSDYKFKLQKAEQDVSTLQANVARLESQVIRYKTAAESSEKAEDELKIEKRKLQRENRESIARIEELETANSHLQRRMDKLKNAKSTLLKEL